MKRRIRRIKRKFETFWDEWGVTKEDCGIIFVESSIFLLPFLFRNILKIFGI